MYKFSRYILIVSASILYLISCAGTDKFNGDPDVILKAISGNSFILGRPTDRSVTVSAMFGENTEFFLEYGTDSTNYDFKTLTFKAEKEIPVNVDLTNLTGNTRYFYRTAYRNGTEEQFFRENRSHHFHTQRAPGSAFTFTVESDEHLYDKKGVRSIYQICLDNQAADNPDFMLSLGDIFGNDHFPNEITGEEIDYLHKRYRPYLGSICHSIPLFICLGNHEGENNFLMNEHPPANLAVSGTLARKKYYPNPSPDIFYSGNTEKELWSIDSPENYYSWTWGDVLFVVLDVYRYQNATTSKPKGWDWTIGAEQYSWLKKTLESSTSKYKLVFAHHVSGQDRGGTGIAKFYEWGGYEQDGVTYGFSARRADFEKPIHRLFVDNNVNIFFQGHDHVFAHEVLDNVTYPHAF